MNQRNFRSSIFWIVKRILLVLFWTNLYSQPKLGVEVGTYLSTSGISPFWHRSNTYGTVPLSTPFTFTRIISTNKFDKKLKFKKKKSNWTMGYGLDVQINQGKETQILIPEAYLKANLSALEIYLGRRKEIVGLIDTTMSSGSYIWSGNSLPMPKVQIGVMNYVPIIGKGVVSIKGAFANGWFDNDRQFTKNIKLHQKWIYTKIGKEAWKINFFFGFNHQVQWGGSSPFYSIDGKLPQSFRDYLSAVIGIRGARKDSLTDYFDANRVGNHLGTVDCAISIKTSKFKILLYRQSIYEDGSLYYLTNITDGFNGISLKLLNKKIIKNICLEYLNTTSQGGDFFVLTDNYLRGRDNYMLNSQYQDGFMYKSNTIGTPFIQLSSLNWRNGKIYTDYFSNNNRVRVGFLSISGQISNISYLMKYSRSLNLGTYISPEYSIKSSIYEGVSIQCKPNLFITKIDLSLNIDFIRNGSPNTGIKLALNKMF